MDGNRRWAKIRGLNPFAGHQEVVKRTSEKIIDHAGKLGIKYLTLWAWSSENWDRPELEVSGIMQLFRWSLENRAKKFISKGARLNVIGDTSKFPPDIQKGIAKMIQDSRENTKIMVTFALNYGGRNEIIRAIKKISTDQKVSTKTLSEAEFSQQLDTANLPDPDLIIRPGGRKRLSGFLLWQSEYAELYFTDTLMPDFGPDELDQAIADFQSRQRTFGGSAFAEIKSQP